MYTGINGLQRGYQPRTDLEKDGKGDLPADSHSILNRQKKCLSIIECAWINDVRQTEI
jgi:hypothetical protein